MNKNLLFKSFKEDALKDAAFKAEYEKLRPEFELIRKLIIARKKAHLSQSALAKKLKLQQPAVARLESDGYASTSLSKLSQVANALGYSLKISLHERKDKKPGMKV